MFEQLTLGDWLVSMIRSAIGAFISGRFASLGEAIHTVISSCLVFAIVVHGVRVMTGDAVGSLKELVKTALWIILAIGITEPQNFSSLIFQPFYSVKDNFSSFILTGNTNETLYEAFSNTNSRMFAHANNILDEAGWTDIGMIFTAAIIYLIYGAYYCLFLGITLYCELSLGTIMLFGAIIIPLSGFQSARQLGKSWIVSLVKYFSVFIIVAFSIGLLNYISDMLIDALMQEVYIQDELNDQAFGLDSPVFGGTLLVGVFGCYLLFQAMEFAAELTGGVMSDGAKGVTSVTNTSIQSMRAMNAGAGAMSGGIAGLKAATKYFKG